MSKGKPRHNPDKKQNKYGDWCSVCDGLTCHAGTEQDFKTCRGNRHNCIKTFYKRLASRSNKQYLNGDYKPR